MKAGSLIFDALKMVYSTLFSFVTIGYCIAISVMVVYRVKREVSRTQPCQSKTNGTQGSKNHIVSLKSLICRTCLYPVTCFLAYIGSNISNIYYFANKKNSTVLVAWQQIGYSSRGILHLFAFLADPIVLTSLQNIFSQNFIQEEDYPLNLKDLSPQSEYSYQYLTSPIPTDSPSSLLRQRMVEDFKRYI